MRAKRLRRHRRREDAADSHGDRGDEVPARRERRGAEVGEGLMRLVFRGAFVVAARELLVLRAP